MKIIIDIPNEFIEEFHRNKFNESLMRLIYDTHLLAGNYEREVALMLINAFENSKFVNEDIAENDRIRNE